MLKPSRFAATAMAALACLLLLSGCGQRPQYKKVSLSAVSETATEAAREWEKEPLRVAVGAMISPKSTFESYNNLLNYLGERLGRPVELVQRATYAEVNDLLKWGKVDMAFVCSGPYVEGHREFGMELLVAPQVRGQTFYYSYIIVPHDSQAQSLEDLRGKIFAFTDPLSNSGHLAPTYMLWQMRERPETFFQKTIFTYSHDNSIKAVAEGLVDGAAVDSLVYDYIVGRDPQYGAKTRIIKKSPPYGIPPVVVHPALDPQLKAQFRDLFLHIHEDERGREILQELMIDRFVIIEDQAYGSVRHMMEVLRWQH